MSKTLNLTSVILSVPLFIIISLVSGCPEERLSVLKQAEDQTDIFDQKSAAEVDILWLIDNSDSMSAEQDKVSNGFTGFFNQLVTSQVDYHIGVITTDPDENGELRTYDGPTVTGCDGCRFLTKEVTCGNPDVATTGLTESQVEAELLNQCQSQLVFRKLIRAGIGGTPFEEGFTQAATAAGLEPVDPTTGFPGGTVPAVNSEFFRDQAALYLIFVSDEDEGAKADGAPLGYYKRLFESLKGAGNENKVSVSAITGWSSDTTVGIDEVCGILEDASHTQHGEVKEILQTRSGCTDSAAGAATADTVAETGSRYIELACQTGGVLANMCDQDYSVALNDLGANAAGLLRKFILTRPNDLDLGADCLLGSEDDSNIDCDGDGVYSGEADSVICVTAKTIGGEQSILVPQDAATGWEWEASTYSIRFGGSFIPAPGSQVEISYKTAVTPRNCGGAE
jgi:hypothetical protein